MRPIFVTIILVVALLAVSSYSINAQTPEQLYQKGLTKEEGEGALQDAINLYNQIVDIQMPISPCRQKHCYISGCVTKSWE